MLHTISAIFRPAPGWRTSLYPAAAASIVRQRSGDLTVSKVQTSGPQTRRHSMLQRHDCALLIHLSLFFFCTFVVRDVASQRQSSCCIVVLSRSHRLPVVILLILILKVASTVEGRVTEEWVLAEGETTLA